MRVHRLEDGGVELFRRYAPDTPLSACVGLDPESGNPIRLTFTEGDAANIMIVGRSRAAALGICTVMVLDLATQVISTPGQRDIYTTPPFSIMDFVATEESRIFVDTAMSLPLAVKLEREVIYEMTSLGDFQQVLRQRERYPDAARHAKFLFVTGFQAAHGLRSLGSYTPGDVTPNAVRFANILRDGNRHSLFSVVWCNTFANLDLISPDGLRHFRHIIVLDGTGRGSSRPSHIPENAVEHAWYLDRSQGTVAPMIPVGLPAESWCETVVRSLS